MTALVMRFPPPLSLSVTLESVNVLSLIGSLKCRSPAAKLSWRAHRAQEALVDFNAVLAQVAARSVAYAVCYLESERARSDLWLQVSSDDEAKVYLNGDEIYRCRVRRRLEALDTAGPVSLKAGSNVLVLKVADEEKEWESSPGSWTRPGGRPREYVSNSRRDPGKMKLPDITIFV